MIFTIFVSIVILFIFKQTIYGCLYGWDSVAGRPPEVSKPPKGFYSRPAFSVFNAYKRLPESHRPPLSTIRGILVALDTKYGKDDANRHFYIDFPFCWCSNNECDLMPEYQVLYREIREINRALAAQEQAHKERERQMVLLGLQSDLDMVGEMIQALRDERSVIVEVTKEIKNITPTKEMA